MIYAQISKMDQIFQEVTEDDIPDNVREQLEQERKQMEDRIHQQDIAKSQVIFTVS